MTTALYERLGLDKSASDTEIKKAYRKLAIKHHPDKGGNEEDFKSISEAYEILSNKEKRQQYDTYGTYDEQGITDFQDLFQNFFHGANPMEHIFGNIFGNAEQQAQHRIPPKEIKVSVSLEEVYSGNPVHYRFFRKIYSKDAICRECNGKGKTVQHFQFAPGMISQNIIPCAICRGVGYHFSDATIFQKKEEILVIDVPKGIPNGKKILLRQKGDQMEDNPNAKGDIIVQFEHLPHAMFKTSKRNPLDLIFTHKITLFELFNGFSFSVKSLDQKTTISFNRKKPYEMIQQSLCYRIPKHGLSGPDRQGDLLLCLTVLLPQSIHDVHPTLNKHKDHSNMVYSLDDIPLEEFEL